MSGNNQNQYFDLHTRGFGFINRARWVKPKKGNPFFAVTIAACRGDDNEKTYIDCKVVGKDAEALLDTHQVDKLNFGPNGDKVSLSFVISDLYLDTFTYGAEHEKAGQFGAGIKGRVLSISYLKINDDVVLSSSQTDANQQAA